VARIRAPPYCGKSVLLSSLKDYIVSKEERNVIIISCLEFQSDRENELNYFNQFWYEETGDINYRDTFNFNIKRIVFHL
jgi:hypothetical protein